MQATPKVKGGTCRYWSQQGKISFNQHVAAGTYRRKFLHIDGYYLHSENDGLVAFVYIDGRFVLLFIDLQLIVA